MAQQTIAQTVARIVTLPGVKQRFVAGMYWHHEERKPTASSLAKNSKEFGKWGLGRKTILGSFQSGYTAPIPGIKNPHGLMSLAAVIADVRPEPWQGMYDLGDGMYWLIAVKDNQQLMPGGDVIGAYDVVLERQQQIASIANWQYMHGSAQDLVLLVQSDGMKYQPAARIRDLQHKSWVAPIMTATALAGAASVGMHYWRAHELHLAVEHAQALARERAIEQAMAEKAASAAAHVVPWQQLPTIGNFLGACRTAWNAQPLDIAGWDLAGWDCVLEGSAVSIRTRWRNAGGSPMDAPGLIATDGKTSRLDGSGPGVQMSSSPSAESLDTAARRLLYIQSIGAAQVAVRLDQAQPGPNPAIKAAPPQPWDVAQVHIESPAPLWSLGLVDRLNAIPGLRLSEVSWSRTNGGWMASGNLYVRKGGPQ
ncbi:MAG: type 4b pilus protein PilO2 [Betaproteobacteria bacterium]|nr:type 4b pilus protein PilO2 [Betaproteobacteria bacterium]